MDQQKVIQNSNTPALMLSLSKMLSVANTSKISDHQCNPGLSRRQDVTMLHSLWLEK